MSLLLEFVRSRRRGGDNPFNDTGNYTTSSLPMGTGQPQPQARPNGTPNAVRPFGPADRHEDEDNAPPPGFVDTPGGVVHNLTPRQGPNQASNKTPTRSVSSEVTPEGRALLDTIAGTESPGYNVLYGGKQFNDLSQHPGIHVPIQRGPNAGKTSSAAGRYQFLLPTWNRVSNELGLKDFSPESQDKGAWHLAQQTYGQKTGRNLQDDLANGKHDLVGQALHGQWTSLPGGIEQGRNNNSQTFTRNFNQNLGRYTSPTNPGTQVASATNPPSQPASNPTAPQTGSSTSLSTNPDQHPQQTAMNTPSPPVQNAPPPSSPPPSTTVLSGQTSPSPQQVAPAPQAANDNQDKQNLAASASPRVRNGSRKLAELNTVRGKNMPNLRRFFEANPVQAGLQVDFEEREADPLNYGMPTHNIHPASEVDPGADDGTGAPYDGAMMPPGQEGQQGLPPGGAMPMQDDQMSPIGPGSGTRQPPPQPGMQESMDLDLLLDDILSEAPGDNSANDLNSQQLGLMGQHGAGQNFAPSMYQAPTQPMQQRWDSAPAQPGMMSAPARQAPAPAAPGAAPARPAPAPARPAPAPARPAPVAPAPAAGGERAPAGNARPAAAAAAQPRTNGVADHYRDNTPVATRTNGVADRDKDNFPTTATQPVGNLGASMLPGAAAAAGAAYRGAPLRGAPTMGARGSQLLNPAANGANPIGANTPGLSSRGAQILNPASNAAENPGLMSRVGGAVRGATSAVGRGLSAAGNSLSGASSAAGDVLSGAKGMAGRGLSAAAPYLGTAAKLGAKAIPGVGTAAAMLSPSDTSAAAGGSHGGYTPPVGWNQSAPAARQPTASNTATNDTLKDWALGWSDYNVLYESDRAKDKKVRGY